MRRDTQGFHRIDGIRYQVVLEPGIELRATPDGYVAAPAERLFFGMQTCRFEGRLTGCDLGDPRGPLPSPIENYRFDREGKSVVVPGRYISRLSAALSR